MVAETGDNADEGIEYSNSQRPTDDEFNEKIMFVYDLVVQCKKVGEIKRRFRGKYDRRKKTKSTDATIRGYIKRARAVMLLHADVTRDQEKASSIAYWRSIIADPKQAPAEKRYARVRLDKIMGIDAPLKIAPTKGDGTDLDFDQAMTMLEKLSAQISDDESED